MTEINFDDVCLVWGESVGGPVHELGPGVGVGLWADVISQRWMRWDPRTDSCPDLSQCSVAFINLFHTKDSLHVEQLKKHYPSIKVIASPDPSLDLILMHDDWWQLWQQLQLADAIACRTQTEVKFYSAMLDGSCYYTPSPIGPLSYFDALADEVKGSPSDEEPYILSLDHAFAPPNTACNIAVLRGIQRQTGFKVKYMAAHDQTKRYAEIASLFYDDLGRVDPSEAMRLTAKASLVVDLYASHSVGRQQLLSAALKTPILASKYCYEAPGWHVDPFDVAAAINSGVSLLTDKTRSYDLIMGQRDWVEKFSFDECRRRFIAMLNKVKYHA